MALKRIRKGEVRYVETRPPKIGRLALPRAPEVDGCMVLVQRALLMPGMQLVDTAEALAERMKRAVYPTIRKH